MAASFYSDDPEVHDRITKGREAGVGTSTVWSPSSGLACHYVSGSSMEEDNGHERRVCAFLESIGVSSISSDRMRGVGRGGRIAMNEPTERFGELCGKCWGREALRDPLGHDLSMRLLARHPNQT